MKDSENIQVHFDEAVSEIATILAQGYLRYIKGLRLCPLNADTSADASQVKESKDVTKKPLDC